MTVRALFPPSPHAMPAYLQETAKKLLQNVRAKFDTTTAMAKATAIPIGTLSSVNARLSGVGRETFLKLERWCSRNAPELLGKYDAIRRDND